MESTVQEIKWLPKFSFNDLPLEDWNGEHRNDWRISILQDLFAKNISTLINQLEKTFKISKLILWENIAVYIFWLYETELKEDADFRCLLFVAEGELFGEFKQNPLQKYFSKRIPDEVRFRETCCFSYQLTSGKRCKTCPCSNNMKDGRCQNGEGFCSTI